MPPQRVDFCLLITVFAGAGEGSRIDRVAATVPRPHIAGVCWQRELFSYYMLSAGGICPSACGWCCAAAEEAGV